MKFSETEKLVAFYIAVKHGGSVKSILLDNPSIASLNMIEYGDPDLIAVRSEAEATTILEHFAELSQGSAQGVVEQHSAIKRELARMIHDGKSRARELAAGVEDAIRAMDGPDRLERMSSANLKAETTNAGVINKLNALGISHGSRLMDDIDCMFDYSSSAGLRLDEHLNGQLEGFYSQQDTNDLGQLMKLHSELCGLVSPATPTSIRATRRKGNGWRVENPTNNFLIWATVVSLFFYVVTSISLTTKLAVEEKPLTLKQSTSTEVDSSESEVVREVQE